MRASRKKIGRILLENNFISKAILNEALEYWRKFGIGITQYLTVFGYISEEELAKCISEQFGLPYLPVNIYDIPRGIIDLVPLELVKKYWLIPIDQVEGIITVVMSDPLDKKAIKEVEDTTGCRVQPFVGIISHIVKAIENNYEVIIESMPSKKRIRPSLFIDKEFYKGFERRRSDRLEVRIDAHISLKETHQEGTIKDVSLDGLLLESDEHLTINSCAIVHIKLPGKHSPYPIAAVVQIARVSALKNNKYSMGARIIKIPKEDMESIISYAQKEAVCQ